MNSTRTTTRTSRRRLRTWLVTLVGALVIGTAGVAAGVILNEATGTTSTSAPIGVATTTQVVWTVQSITTVTPGGMPKKVKFSFTNATLGPMRVSAVNVAITGTSAAGCTPSWFTLTPGQINVNRSPVTLPASVPAGAVVTDDTGGVWSTSWTISMPAISTYQTACAGGHVTLKLSVS